MNVEGLWGLSIIAGMLCFCIALGQLVQLILPDTQGEDHAREQTDLHEEHEERPRLR